MVHFFNLSRNFNNSEIHYPQLICYHFAKSYSWGFSDLCHTTSYHVFLIMASPSGQSKYLTGQTKLRRPNKFSIHEYNGIVYVISTAVMSKCVFAIFTICRVLVHNCTCTGPCKFALDSVVNSKPHLFLSILSMP